MLIGVNSRTEAPNDRLSGTSYISPTYAEPLAKFILGSLENRTMIHPTNAALNKVCIAERAHPSVDCR
jgi:hypothetical protein